MAEFQSTLDLIASAGYDVSFLRGEAPNLLKANPVVKKDGPEHFEPKSAPMGALAANGPWAARLLQGGGTMIDELAGGQTWSGSLDLSTAARRVGEMVSTWMQSEESREDEFIAEASKTFPLGATVAEQFYSLRDAVHFSEQWLPGRPSSRPALTLLLAFCIGVDEFLCPLDSIDSTIYLGRQVSSLWKDCLEECHKRDDAAGWLALAQDALRSSVFLQNREKFAHVNLDIGDKQVFVDWDTTSHYMLRAEAAMTPFVGFCLCAYAGLPFRRDLAGAVGLYCYNNAFVLDFCKRATRLGAGNYTEISLVAAAEELRGRSHLIGSILAYGENTLPPLYLCVLRPYVLATSSVVDVLDRYRERSWGFRLPVGQATLQMMENIMERAQASLHEPGSQTHLHPNCLSASGIIESLDVRAQLNKYYLNPSDDSFLRVPRSVREALLGRSDPKTKDLSTSGNHHGTNGDHQGTNGDHEGTNGADGAGAAKGAKGAKGANRALTASSPSWMQLLQDAQSLTLPEQIRHASLEEVLDSTARFPVVRVIDCSDVGYLAVQSPARPGGFAAGKRFYVGRPAGAAPAPV